MESGDPRLSSTQGTEGHTEGIHLFNASSYSYSWPSSVSRINLLSSLEKEIRGSASNSDGSWGKRDGGVSGGASVAIALKPVSDVDFSK